MKWLNLELPDQTAFRAEQQRRELRNCNDPDVLRAIAEALVQEVHHLGNVVNQLVGQVAELEVDLAKAGAFPAPSAEHMDWATQILKDLRPTAGSS